jgi:hypothetical protein
VEINVKLTIGETYDVIRIIDYILEKCITKEEAEEVTKLIMKFKVPLAENFGVDVSYI